MEKIPDISFFCFPSLPEVFQNVAAYLLQGNIQRDNSHTVHSAFVIWCRKAPSGILMHTYNKENGAEVTV